MFVNVNNKMLHRVRFIIYFNLKNIIFYISWFWIN